LLLLRRPALGGIRLRASTELAFRKFDEQTFLLSAPEIIF